MQGNNTKFFIALLLCAAMTGLHGCKELDEVLDSLEDDDTELSSTEPMPGAPEGPGIMPHDPHYHEMGQANITSISLNDMPLSVEVNDKQEPWRVMNSATNIAESGEVNSISISFSNRDGLIDSFLGHTEIRLQSLIDHQSVFVVVSGLMFENNALVISPDSYMDIYYEDMMRGMFMPVPPQDPMQSDILMVEANKLILDVNRLFDVLASHQGMEHGIHEHDMATSTTAMNDNGDMTEGVMDTSADTTMTDHDALMSSENPQDLKAHFFSSDLFAIKLYSEAELYYQNTMLNSLSNCVYASTMSSPPTDIQDICRAYLSMY